MRVHKSMYTGLASMCESVNAGLLVCTEVVAQGSAQVR